jgi:hypothetical protein
MTEKDNVVGIRAIENVPAGRPFIVAWFDEDGAMHWNCNSVTNAQIAYFAARLTVEAVDLGKR